MSSVQQGLLTRQKIFHPDLPGLPLRLSGHHGETEALPIGIPQLSGTLFDANPRHSDHLRHSGLNLLPIDNFPMPLLPEGDVVLTLEVCQLLCVQHVE